MLVRVIHEILHRQLCWGVEQKQFLTLILSHMKGRKAVAMLEIVLSEIRFGSESAIGGSVGDAC